MTHRTALFPILALLVLAAPPFTSQAVALPPVGEPVTGIEDADRISGFEALDPRRLVVSVGKADNYVLTLAVACHRLAYATNVGVSMADNTIWAGFDYVTADGWQCPIESISKVTRADLKRLRS
jgi:hypothetical protein